jgi:hypothetical protein
MNQDIAVCIATDYELNGRVKNFHSLISSRPALGPTQLPIKWILGVISSEIKVAEV